MHPDSSIFQDLRFALRGFKRNFGFTFAAVLIIALGIGATTAVFSVVDRLLFRSAPYPQSERLVSLGITIPWMDYEFLVANDYLHLREHQSIAFSAITSWTGIADCDLSEENPQRLACAQVESTFLPMFGIKPLFGRNFHASEDPRNAPKVALLSHGLWKSRFGGNPRVLGKTIHLDGTPTEIIGVLPSDFELPNLAHVDVLVPQGLAISQYQPRQSGRPLRVFGRLKDGVSAQQAQSMARAYMIEGIADNLPPDRQRELKTVVRSLRDYQIHDVKLAAWLLFGSTAAILLIVCANMANLLLARSVSRRRELAMRAALGASRGRLIRQSLTECLLLSGGGAAVGCGIAWTLLQIFKMLAPVSIPRLQQAELDIRVLLFTVVVTLVCGIAFALPSALANPEPELLTSGSRTTGSSRNKLRHLLTMTQIAVSLVLLSVAGLLIKSLWNLQNVVSGMDAEHVVAADITVGPRSYPNAASRQRFFDTLAERLRSLPGIKAVAMSDTAPPNGFVHTRPFGALQAMGKPAPDSYLSGGIVAWRSVSPDYFRALGIQILNGRGFREEETKSKDNVIVISTSLAHGLFQNQDPLGKALKVGPQSPIFTVVGVVADVKNNGLSQNADPEYYLPRKQITDPNIGRDESMVGRAVHAYDGEAFVIVRGSARTEAMANWIRSETAAMDQAVPATITTMQWRIRADSERPRFSAILLSFFAFVGVVLAAAGLYVLISFLVEQRTQEIGVRMAVGATGVQVAGLILWHTLRWSLGGVVVGLAAVVVLARSLRSLVFHTPVESPILFGSMALLMLVVAALAALRPALRVANIDPMAALRHE